MKIILGGGWGYGNIGDDLILASTIEIIKNINPKSEFTVLTYSKKDSVSHCNENIKLEYTLHRNVDLNNTKYKFINFNESITIYSKVMERITKLISDSEVFFNYKSKKHIENHKKIIIDSDIYIMCGGGYFNEKWVSKVRSQLVELELAQEAGIKTAILGPTIGKIPKQLQHLAKKVFGSADLVIVRDESSKKTLAKIGVKADVIPDIAMGCWEVNEASDSIKQVGIAYTSGYGVLNKFIVDDLTKYYNQKNGSIELKFIITRRWKGDFESAQIMMLSLLNNGIKSKLIIPSDHVSLELEMTKCDLVISENLHGLISASRNLIPVIAINDYDPESPNGKKFLGFLKQFGIEKYYVNSSSKPGVLHELISEIESDYSVLSNNLSLNRNKTNLDYSLKLKEFLI